MLLGCDRSVSNEFVKGSHSIAAWGVGVTAPAQSLLADSGSAPGQLQVSSGSTTRPHGPEPCSASFTVSPMGFGSHRAHGTPTKGANLSAKASHRLSRGSYGSEGQNNDLSVLIGVH